MNIATIFSPNWINYFLIFAYSTFKNNPAPIKLYLLSDELEQSDLDKIDKLCDYFGEGYEIKYINVLPLYNKYLPSGINADSRFTKYTLYKIFLSQIIKKDRILFLDGDTVVNGNLSEFYNTDFEDKFLMAGAEDTGLYAGYKKSIGLAEDDIYVNAGSLLFNLKEIRKLKIDKEWIKLLNTKLFECHEQCVFNLTLKNKIKVVDAKYNVSLSTSLNYKENEGVVLHYAGSKPWSDKNVPNYQIWDKWQKEYDDAMKYKIPKIIYTCWFGHGEKPDIVKECMATWKQVMPEYKIIEIDENNFDVNSHPYAKKAYEQKKWAFLTDYVRLKVLYDNGGIYMDADVKVLKKLDRFLEDRAFTGYEADCWMLAATMGAEKRHPWIKTLLDYYDTAELDDIPNTQIVTKLSESWVESKTRDCAYLREGVVIYPTSYFCPYDHKALKPTIKNDSYTCHMFLGSWVGRTPVHQKKYEIDFSEIMDVVMNWQMSLAERSSIYYILNKMKNHNSAIEIGSFQGGLTFVLDKYFKKVYSLDVNHSLIFNKSQYKNTYWITGDSRQTLPTLIDRLNNEGEDVNFVLVDANHEQEFVLSDVNNLLRYKPKSDLILLIHDSWYLHSRRAICAIPWKNNPYVHYVNTDFCQGELMHSNGKNIFVGGLCLVVMSPQLREIPLVIEQPHDYTYCKTNQVLGNPI